MNDTLERSAIVTQIQELLRLNDITTARINTEVASGQLGLHELKMLRTMAKSPDVDSVMLAEWLDSHGAIRTLAVYGVVGLTQDLSYHATLNEIGISDDILTPMRFRLQY